MNKPYATDYGMLSDIELQVRRSSNEVLQATLDTLKSTYNECSLVLASNMWKENMCLIVREQQRRSGEKNETILNLIKIGVWS